MTLTKRDLIVAAASACLTGGIFALAQAKATPVIGASTYPWQSMQAKTTPIGEVRQVIKGPTATLEELELHITTLNPGQASHPPHHHAN